MDRQTKANYIYTDFKLQVNYNATQNVHTPQFFHLNENLTRLVK